MHALHIFDTASVADLTEVMPSTPLDRLSARDEQALDVGRQDAGRFGWDASLPKGFLRRTIAEWIVKVTGLERARPFADERLELLRLFACMMRRGDRRLAGIADRLLILGVGPTALHQAVARALR
jgi:hypothetical protein